MTRTETYYDRESDKLFEVELPEIGSVWERVPNIKDVLPTDIDTRVSDIPKRVEVLPNTQNPTGLTMVKDLSDGTRNGFHPHWFNQYYKEVENV